MTTQNPLGPANVIGAVLLAMALCAFSAIDSGPSDHQAMQATAASVQDAEALEHDRLKTIAAQAHRQAVRAKKQAQKAAQASQLAAAQ